MFAFELTTASPCGSAPYYSLVIRDPYVIGHHSNADIELRYSGLSEEHVSLTVLHAHEAAQELVAAKRDHDDAEVAEANDSADTEAVVAELEAENALVVRVTALPTAGEAEVRIGNVRLYPGDSVVARDGDVLTLGNMVTGTFHYRPLMVGLDTDAFPTDYVADLRRMFVQLGATIVEEPAPVSEGTYVPIGQLYCVDELNDGSNALSALAYGYSVVQPTYVFEWFAAVARRASAPLSTLPPPSRFEVPVRCTTHPTTTAYLRPESDGCPFSLFPIPATALTKRSRADLFAGRVFFFFTDAAATRYWRTVEDCGGVVYGPGDVDQAREAIHHLVEAQYADGATAKGMERVPSNFYIIIDNISEAVLLNSGLEEASPELLGFMEDAAAAYGASNLCVMGDHSLFTSLLSNEFCEEPIPLLTGANVNGNGGGSLGGGVAEESLATGRRRQSTVSARTPRQSSMRPYEEAGTGSMTARSLSRVGTIAEERRRSLLPRSEHRTPSRSQMRSYSRQRAQSAAAEEGMEAETSSFFAGTSSPRSARSSSRGRRRLVPSVMDGDMRSFAEDFDRVRLRLYAFLMREESKLDTAIRTFHRCLYTENDTVEYALEVKAQAAEFLERIDDLLADPVCHGAYADSLRRFWKDASEMDNKAQHLLHCCDRRFTAVPLSSRRTSARYTASRRGSLAKAERAQGNSSVSRSNTPRSGRWTAPSPAPALPEERLRATGATATTSVLLVPVLQSRSPVRSEEHRGLYTSPEAVQRLTEVDRIQEQFYTAADVAMVTARDGQSDVVIYEPDAHSRASSRRRVSTPRRRVKAPKSVPIDKRPPWVSEWEEDSRPVAPPRSKRTSPTSTAAGAEDASDMDGGEQHEDALTPSHYVRAAESEGEEDNGHYVATVSDTSILFTVEDSKAHLHSPHLTATTDRNLDSITEEVVFTEEGPITSPKAGATAVNPPGAEEEAEVASQQRRAPAPQPQPAPKRAPRRRSNGFSNNNSAGSAPPASRKVRSKSGAPAKATNGAARPNTTGQANGNGSKVSTSRRSTGPSRTRPARAY